MPTSAVVLHRPQGSEDVDEEESERSEEEESEEDSGETPAAARERLRNQVTT